MDVPNRRESRNVSPDIRYSDGLSHPKAVAFMMFCVVLGLAVLFLVALGIEQWINGSGIDAPSETRPAQTAPVMGYPPPAMAENPAAWITSDDYPADSLRNSKQGTVRIGWTIEPSGRIGKCEVLATSGHPSLDEAACNAIRRRGRYNDIRPDTHLRQASRRVVWRLPSE